MGDVTVDGQEEAARRLAASELRLRALITASADAIFMMDRTGRVTYLSPQMSRAVGTPQPTVDDRMLLAAVHRDDQGEVYATYRAALAGEVGSQYAVTHRIFLKSGELVWIEARIVNQLGVDGVDALVVNARDVTDRERAERQLRRRLEAEDLLGRIASRFVDVLADQLDDALDRTLAEVGAFCEADRAWIFQLGSDGRTVEHTHEWCAPGIPGEIENLRGLAIDTLPAFANWMRDPGPLLIPSVSRMPGQQSSEREVLEAQGIKSLAGSGMFVRGTLYGLVGLDAVTEERHFSDSDVWLLRSVSDVFGAALRRCAVEEALAASEERFRAMIHHATDGVRLLDEGLRTIYASPAVSTITGYAPHEMVDARDRLEVVHRDDRPAVERARAEALSTPGVPVTATYRCRHRDGHWIHLEEVTTNLLDDPSVGGVVANMRDVTADRRHEAELLAQARRDPLTDLPNRRLFDELVDAAISRIGRTGSQLALVYLDLDRFKLVNDSFGHHIGDALLMDAAQRLRVAVRGGDVVARLSGDEFAVLCEPVDGEEEVLSIADRVLAAFREPFTLGGRTIYSTASVGVVLSGDRGGDRARLLRDADAAMYSAKAGGRNRAAVFSGTLVAMARERLEVEVGLRAAVPEEQLRLHYQPIVSLRTGDITGAEALLRWEHPERGMLTPDAFLDVAEETGMIVPIGQWVVREACRQLVLWEASGTAAGLELHVNVSVRQLVEGGIAEAVQSAISATGVDPGALCVEITESALLAGDDANRELKAIRSAGVRLALDDFGTGHSSLSYLRHLDLDMLKIDRSFVDGVVDDEHDTAIVTAIVRLAESLGLSTVGEGVETAAQAAALAVLGCEQAQGYWCSAAVPSVAFEELVRRGVARELPATQE